MIANIKGPLFLVLILGIWAIVIAFYTQTDDNNPYNRKFNGQMEVRTTKYFYEDTDKDFLLNVNSKENLIFFEEHTNTSDDSNFSIVTLNPKNLIEDYRVEIKLPQFSYVEYVSPEKIYYKKGIDFFEYDIQGENSMLLTSEKIKIFKIVPLSRATILCLGTLYDEENKDFIFSFFQFNLNTLEVQKVVKEVHSAPFDNSFERLLQYSGRFIESGNKVAYVCDKYSKIFMFDETGNFTKEIKTIGEVPLPKITFFNNMYTYTKGATFASSSGALINGNRLYVFSCRPWGMKNIMMDEYNIQNSEYMSSYKIDFNGVNANDINALYQVSGEDFVLQIDNYYQGFTISQ